MVNKSQFETKSSKHLGSLNIHCLIPKPNNIDKDQCHLKQMQMPTTLFDLCYCSRRGCSMYANFLKPTF